LPTVRGHQQELIARAQAIGRSGWRWPGSNFVEAIVEVPPFGSQFVSPRRPDQELGQTPPSIFVSKVPPPDVVFTAFGNWFISPPQVPTLRPQDALLGPRGPPLPEAQADQELLFGRLVIHPPLIARRIAPSMRAGLAREIVFTFGNTFISEPRDEGRRQPAPLLRWPIPPEVVEVPPFGSSFISKQRDDGIRQPEPVLVSQVPPPDVNQELLFGRLVTRQQIPEREPGATLRWPIPDDLLSFTRSFISEPRDDGVRQPAPILKWPIPDDLLSFTNTVIIGPQFVEPQPAPLLRWPIPPEFPPFGNSVVIRPQIPAREIGSQFWWPVPPDLIVDQELLFSRLIVLRPQFIEREPGAHIQWFVPPDVLFTAFGTQFISEFRDEGFRQPTILIARPPIEEIPPPFGSRFITRVLDEGRRQPAPLIRWPIPPDVNQELLFGRLVTTRQKLAEVSFNKQRDPFSRWFVPPEFPLLGTQFISEFRDEGFRQPPSILIWPVPPDKIVAPIVKIVAVDVLFGKDQPRTFNFGKEQSATFKFGKKLPSDLKF